MKKKHAEYYYIRDIDGLLFISNNSAFIYHEARKTRLPIMTTMNGLLMDHETAGITDDKNEDLNPSTAMRPFAVLRKGVLRSIHPTIETAFLNCNSNQGDMMTMVSLNTWGAGIHTIIQKSQRLQQENTKVLSQERRDYLNSLVLEGRKIRISA